MKIINFTPATKPHEFSRYEFEDGTVVQINESQSPVIDYADPEDADREGVREEYLHDCEIYGVVTEDDIRFVNEGETDGPLGWQCLLSDEELADRNLEWHQVVQFVSEQAEKILDELDYAAWQNACDDGRGPDGENDVIWVADYEDRELVSSIKDLDSFIHPAEIQAALDVIKKHYNLK